jgi:hypothetical protein
MENNTLAQSLHNDFDIELSANCTESEALEKLAAFVNNLINTNFEKLISLLYRMDVSEAKIKTMLQNAADKNAGQIIAALMMERQQQKILLRQSFKTEVDIDENEKW